eukprot:CAMPEP_0168459556 /NCGR_PEP_ID=MMETSP0228-20121227/52978_1 /TAXON_ID=133427 /ORGANISM="Protoceratium reticulatum, Strain CCCM 535 (=CCMP 1889)" /LENGTH=273 /DNA_ID=CAMNT_0008474739 /DNA_START=40 /DNA_END=859 /DNA_ORIENTATION=+
MSSSLLHGSSINTPMSVSHRPALPMLMVEQAGIGRGYGRMCCCLLREVVAVHAAMVLWYGAWSLAEAGAPLASALRNCALMCLGVFCLMLADTLLACASIEGTLGVEALTWARLERRPAIRLPVRVAICGQVCVFVGSWDLLDNETWAPSPFRAVLFTVVGLTVEILGVSQLASMRLPAGPSATTLRGLIAVVAILSDTCACLGLDAIMRHWPGGRAAAAARHWGYFSLGLSVFLAAPHCLWPHSCFGLPFRLAVVASSLVHFNASYSLLERA